MVLYIGEKKLTHDNITDAEREKLKGLTPCYKIDGETVTCNFAAISACSPGFGPRIRS